MRRRHLGLVTVNRYTTEFYGYGARELHQRIANGRPPVRNVRTKRWVTSPSRADDLLALAEREGWDVTITSETQVDGDPR